MEPITTQEKRRIAIELKAMAAKTSQVTVSLQAKVSNATISQIINNKHELVSSEMFMCVKANLHLDFTWNNANTANYKLLKELMDYAKENSTSHGVSEDAGYGKTNAYRRYARQNTNVILIECKNIWTRKSYVTALLSACGLRENGTLQEMAYRVIKHLKKLHCPIVIIDQMDKLKDPPMDLYMDFYNELDGYCGFILSGTRALEKKIKNGVLREKIGYAELYSRIHRKFVRLDPIKQADVQKICHANGVYDIDIVNYIYDCCQGDYRIVKKDVQLEQKQQTTEYTKQIDVDFQVVEVQPKKEPELA